MGSKRKRDEKKRDFQKRKLKVGKTAAKPDNYTDTSFTAKSISLPNQTIAKKPAHSAPGNPDVDLTHHLLLTKHHLASTRKETLIYIETHLPSNTSLYKQILSLTLSLVTDSSQSVREAFVSLLSACADKQPGFLELHMRSIVLFVHSAMTHIQVAVRSTSSMVLGVLVEKSPSALVRGHFVKILRSFFSLMSWNFGKDRQSVSLAVSSDSLEGRGQKARVNHLCVLRKFLKASLFEEKNSTDALAIDWSKCSTIHWQTPKFMIPSNPQAYAQLKLYVEEIPASVSSDTPDGSLSLADIDGISTEDQDTRRRITLDIFSAPLKANLFNIVKEGGEVGKEAQGCIATLDKLEKEMGVQLTN